MKTKEEILAECADLDLCELEYKNEVQVIRPSEALEAMDMYIKEGIVDFCKHFKIPFSSQITELENGLAGFKIYSTEEIVDKYIAENRKSKLR